MNLTGVSIHGIVRSWTICLNCDGLRLLKLEASVNSPRLEVNCGNPRVLTTEALVPAPALNHQAALMTSTAEFEKYFFPDVSILYELVLPWKGETVVDVSFDEASTLAGLAERFSMRVACRLTATPLSAAAPSPSTQEDLVLVSRNSWELPLNGDSIDCVVLHGTLDQISEDSARGWGHDPRAALLDSVYRVLKPGGMLALTASNCLHPSYSLARACGGRHRGAKCLRPKTYWGHRRLLRRAGFEITGSYAVIPNYDRPLHIVSCSRAPSKAHYIRTLSNPRVYKSKLLRKLAIGLSYFGWLPFLERDFLVTAKK